MMVGYGIVLYGMLWKCEGCVIKFVRIRVKYDWDSTSVFKYSYLLA